MDGVPKNDHTSLQGGIPIDIVTESMYMSAVVAFLKNHGLAEDCYQVIHLTLRVGFLYCIQL